MMSFGENMECKGGIGLSDNVGLVLPCLFCGQKRQCSQLFCDQEEELEVASNLCKLLSINYGDIRDLSLEDSYYCSECLNELLLNHRLQTELGIITKQLDLLKSTCLGKFNKEAEFFPEDSSDLMLSVQFEKRRKFCNYVTNQANPLTTIISTEIKQETFEDDYMEPASDLSIEGYDVQSDNSNCDEKTQAVAVNLPFSQDGKPNATSRRCKNGRHSKNASPAKLLKSAAGSSKNIVSVGKKINDVPKTHVILSNETHSERSIRSRARKDYSQLFLESSDEMESSSESESVTKEIPGGPSEVALLESTAENQTTTESVALIEELFTVPLPSLEDTEEIISPEETVEDAQDSSDVHKTNPEVKIKDARIQIYKLDDDDLRIKKSKKKWEIKVMFYKGALRYLCPLKWCKHRFLGVSLLKVHFRKFHMKISDPYECEECWTRFSTKEEYEEHEAQEVVLKKERQEKLREESEKRWKSPGKEHLYTCEECGKTFEKRRLLKSHMETHVSDVYEPEEPVNRRRDATLFRCSVKDCKAKFFKEVLLQAHVLMVHEGVTHPFVCQICYKGFKELSKLEEHRNVHSNEKPFECPNCDKRFSLRRHRDYHVTTSHKPKSFQCDTCGMVFSLASQLNYHQLVHSDVKSFTCEVCGLSFKRKQDLRRHLPDHPELNLPKNICSFCGKTFKILRYLQDHERRHTGEGLHRCTLCNFTAPRQHDIVCHMISHSTDRQHECDMCFKKFKTELAVKKHKESSHALARDHVCNKCGKGFFSSTRLRVHIFTVHESRTYSCSLCPSTFTRRGNVRRHMITSHPRELQLKKSTTMIGTINDSPMINLPSQVGFPAFHHPQDNFTTTPTNTPDTLNPPVSQPQGSFPVSSDLNVSEEPDQLITDGNHPTPVTC